MRAYVGMSPEEVERLETVRMESVAPLLEPSLERDGVVLVDRADAHARVDPSLHGASFSNRNGRGHRAWKDHVLLVPLRDREGRLEGTVWWTNRSTACCRRPRSSRRCAPSPTTR